MEMFKHGQTVRFVGFGTPSQRQCLWVVSIKAWGGEDVGGSDIEVHRQTDPDCIIWAPRRRITGANLLDLIASL